MSTVSNDVVSTFRINCGDWIQVVLQENPVFCTFKSSAEEVAKQVFLVIRKNESQPPFDHILLNSELSFWEHRFTEIFGRHKEQFGSMHVENSCRILDSESVRGILGEETMNRMQKNAESYLSNR